MPRRPLKPCTFPGCSRLVERDCCDLHARSKRSFYKAQDENRGFYSSVKWQRLRGWFIRRNPVCVLCLRPAEVVDHILAIKDGGEALSDANLQSLCNRCHQRKRGQEAHHIRGGGVKSLGASAPDRHPNLTNTAAKFEDVFYGETDGKKTKT
jgi:5-methylcytosine-specific restriction protein A